MATKRSPIVAGPKQNRLSARQDIALAFENCLTHTHTTRDGAASQLGISKRTIATWLRCEGPISVEVILGAPSLAKAFRRALCTEHHEPLPYVTKKRKARRV